MACLRGLKGNPFSICSLCFFAAFANIMRVCSVKFFKSHVLCRFATVGDASVALESLNSTTKYVIFLSHILDSGF